MYAKRNPSPHTKLLAKADKYFSLWFRANEANENGIVACVTCGKRMMWKMADGGCHTGHFESRGHSSVRFMPENCGVQCKKCNTYQEGRKPDFETYLRKRYGNEKVDKIKIFAKMTQKRLSDFELNQIAKYYKTDFEKIIKIKGL